MTTRTVLTVGTFDGVHRGHRAVLDEIARRAAASGLTSVLLTFEPHPLEVVNPQAAPPLLTLPGVVTTPVTTPVRLPPRLPPRSRRPVTPHNTRTR